MLVAEKIRTALANPYRLNLHAEKNPENSVEHKSAASIGVNLFIGQQASEDDILKCADNAMYQAKEAGRNLIRFYERAI